MGIKVSMREQGQMTVELAVAFPVLIAIAVVVTNAALFLSECAAFDNLFRDSVRVCAISPAYGVDVGQTATQVEEFLSTSFDEPFESVSTVAEGVSSGHVCFTGTLELSPTLFGLRLKSSIFGVSLPKMVHEISLVVDVYKPSVVA